MLIYYNSGFRDFTTEPVPVNSRTTWEFFVALSGGISPVLIGRGAPVPVRERTMWVFPREHPHGWVGEDKVDRLVFHFTKVPGELEQMVPPSGFYQVALTDDDCAMRRKLTERAADIMEHPTKLFFLQTQALVSELSLMALREVDQPTLTSHKIARSKTEQALAWYREHVSEAPTFNDVTQAVHVSPTHLRRLFHYARGETPHQAMNRIRMEVAEELLKGTDAKLDEIAARVGLSNGSALSRAMKAHFGITPRNLRRGIRPLHMHKASMDVTFDTSPE